MNRFAKSIIIYLLLFLVLIGIFEAFNSSGTTTKSITYTEFRAALAEGKVAEVHIRPDGLTYRIEGRFVGDNTTTFVTQAPFSDMVIQQIEAAEVPKQVYAPEEGPSIWVTLLTSFVPFLILFALLFFLMNQAQGGGNRVMNFGKSRARMVQDDKRKVTFNDVAGADEEKAELEEIVAFLKDPRKFSALGARIPKGVLLVGPPGTGKTLLARAVAGEAGVPFFSISGSDFVEMFVGVGASRVRDLFENAKKNAPCIIFIDEIDAVGRQRGAGLGGGHDEREQTLNQLLVEMDGFNANEGIIIIAATNRPDILDPALLRPGRFDRQITVDRPDVKGREEVLKVHARNKPLGEDVDLKVLARRTTGFTGADLENVLNEAALLAARKNKKQINMPEVDEAIDRVIAGPEKRSRVVSETERKLVAYHEAGHAIVGLYLENADTVHKVTIVPRGNAGGYTVMLPKEDRFFMRKTELMERIIGLLGGRVAEELAFGDVSTGAHNDFERATEIARRMVTEFGMSEKLGPMQFGRGQGEVFLGRDFARERNYSDKVAYEIDQEIRHIIQTCYERCKQLLTEHYDELELLAQTLLEKETLDEYEIRALIKTGKLPDDDKDGEKKEVKLQIHGKPDMNEPAAPDAVPNKAETMSDGKAPDDGERS